VLRFPDVRAGSGCLAAGVGTPAMGHPPAALALRLRTTSRARRPARRLGVVRARCARTCTLRATATASSQRGRRLGSTPLDVRIEGRTITITAGATAVRALRAAVRAGGYASAALTVEATGAGGVVDTASVTWSFDGSG
jgi:hypothetical protein